jgi:hypothetical protein
MNTYYCPRGCNVCDERAANVTGFECGACGCRMTTDSRPYDAVHDRIQDEAIAAFERKQMKDDVASIASALQELSSFETRANPHYNFAPKALAALERVKERLGEIGELPAD